MKYLFLNQMGGMNMLKGILIFLLFMHINQLFIKGILSQVDFVHSGVCSRSLLEFSSSVFCLFEWG